MSAVVAGYALCPSCGGDGTVAPDRGATGRPWCRPCLGTGLLLGQGDLPTGHLLEARQGGKLARLRRVARERLAERGDRRETTGTGEDDGRRETGG